MIDRVVSWLEREDMVIELVVTYGFLVGAALYVAGQVVRIL